jgi:hypothetical protein
LSWRGRIAFFDAAGKRCGELGRCFAGGREEKAREERPCPRKENPQSPYPPTTGKKKEERRTKNEEERRKQNEERRR